MIKGECGQCGPVELADVIVHIWPASLTCSWSCTVCGARGVKDCSPHIAELLEAAGCPIERIVLPAVECGSGPPIGWDDVLDMRLALNRDDWHAELNS